MLSKFALAVTTAACVGLGVKTKTLVASQQPEHELCQVQVVFRHGARTPLHVPDHLPAVPYEEDLLNHHSKTFVKYKVIPLSGIKHSDSPFEEAYKKRGRLVGGCLPGQLTHIGADQTYQLGEYLRRRYIVEHPFLSSNYENLSQEIYTRSTNIERTIDSARCVLAGILGESREDPLYIHVASANEEIMYPNYYTCAHLKHLTRWAWDEPDRIPGVKEIRESVQNSLGLQTSDEVNLVSLRDNFAVEATHEKPSLQTTLSPEIRDKIEKSAMLIMKTAFVGQEDVRETSLKLAIGPFVDVLLNNMEKVCDEKDPETTKMNLFSGHDTTLIPLLSALGIEFTEWPTYAANVILELHRKNGSEHFVRLLYNGKEQAIGSCKPGLCPFEEFKKSVDHVRMSHKEYAKDCILDGRVY